MSGLKDSQDFPSTRRLVCLMLHQKLGSIESISTVLVYLESIN
jgi:hypothetical protein